MDLAVLRILIVEDSNFRDALLSTVRDKWPYSIIRVEISLSDARKALSEFQPHLLFLDWNLGGTGNALSHGTELLANIVTLDKENPGKHWARYPFVVHLSAHIGSADDSGQRGTNAEADAAFILQDRSRRVKKTRWESDSAELLNHIDQNDLLQQIRVIRYEKTLIDLSKIVVIAATGGRSLEYIHINNLRKIDSIPWNNQDNPLENLLCSDAAALPFVKSWFWPSYRKTLVNLALAKAIQFDENGHRKVKFENTKNQSHDEDLANAVANLLRLNLHITQINQLNGIDDPSITYPNFSGLTLI